MLKLSVTACIEVCAERVCEQLARLEAIQLWPHRSDGLTARAPYRAVLVPSGRVNWSAA
jgi:hypothetical protein